MSEELFSTLGRHLLLSCLHSLFPLSYKMCAGKHRCKGNKIGYECLLVRMALYQHILHMPLDIFLENMNKSMIFCLWDFYLALDSLWKKVLLSKSIWPELYVLLSLENIWEKETSQNIVPWSFTTEIFQ